MHSFNFWSANVSFSFRDAASFQAKKNELDTTVLRQLLLADI